MEPASSPGDWVPESCAESCSCYNCSCYNFLFAFNKDNFSDKMLLLEITDYPEIEAKPDEEVLRNSIAEPPPPQVKSVHIVSSLLARRSQFFLKLFTNGMKESKQKHVTIRIKAIEEKPFMDLLKYIYSNNLPTSLLGLLDLLKIADKFEVVSCLSGCVRSLLNLPMTCKSASYYLDLPQSLVMSPTIQPILDAAKHFLVARFKDLDKFKEAVLNLPLASIKAVVSSDDLKVASECVVYDLILTWAHKHYPNLEERRGILKTHLLHLVRFPFLTTAKLIEEVQTCRDIDPELASKIVIRALHYKAETPHRKRCLAAEDANAASHQFVKRAYTFRHVKVVEFESPHRHQCSVYLDLKREELTDMHPYGNISSESFHLGGKEFVLIGNFTKGNQSWGCWHHNFCLSLKVVGSGSAACTIDYDIAVRKKKPSDSGLQKKPLDGFESWVTGSHTFTTAESPKYMHVTSWNDLTANSSPYFINGVLHLRADLTIR